VSGATLDGNLMFQIYYSITSEKSGRVFASTTTLLGGFAFVLRNPSSRRRVLHEAQDLPARRVAAGPVPAGQFLNGEAAVYIRVDLSQVPPLVELCDQEDFTSFKVSVQAPPHAWIDPSTLTTMAGRADDGAWQSKLTSMIAYARSHGWLDESGRIRAHVELAENSEHHRH
jgi:hypothetical protein